MVEESLDPEIMTSDEDVGNPEPLRVLAIDDEPAALRIVKNILTEKTKYEVEIVDSASEALRKLSLQTYELIILDAIMPVMSGYDLVKVLRRHPQFNQIPILMLTRKRDKADVKKALDIGVTDYATKPIDEQLFLNKVELCIRKGEGSRHIFELQLSGEQASAKISMDAKVASISETDLILRLPFPITAEHAYKLRINVFHEIGIDMPFLNFLRCNQVGEVEDVKGLPYEVLYTFVGVPEADLKKIRSWIQKEAIRRRK